MKTDAQIRDDVLAELKWEPAVRACNIGVDVQDGVVSLDGDVESLAEKWRSESAAQRVSGVNRLVNAIEVKLPGLGKRSDSEIAQLAKKVLEWTSSVPAGAVKVKVQGGWLTLSGEVDWQYQRTDAAQALRDLSGITGVSNDLRIRVKAAPASLKADVELALKRGSWPNREQLSVAVHEGEITLSGSVRSRAERELAAHSAWNAPGVHNVVNKITVTD
ncbi:MAG: BON domain-containing protein [Rudaea sp.]